MKKFMMLLAALAMGASIFFGLLNKKFLEETKNELDGVNADISKVTTELGEVEDKLVTAKEEEGQAKDARNQASADVEGVRQNLKIAANSLDKIKDEFAKIEVEKQEIAIAVKKTFPDGQVKTADELRMKLTMLKEQLTDKQNAKAEYEAQLDEAAKQKKEMTAKVKQEEEFQRKRAQRLQLNGMVATVIAVNNEWGFVMVNAGRQHGVEANASLLVRRGNSRIARLRIAGIQDRMTVANVVEDTVSSGLSVQPGDQVIFENAP